MTQSIWPSLLALVFVLVLIPASLWLVRAMRQMTPAASGPLAILHRQVLGPREQIAIVRAGSKMLVVGITAQSIQTLCELPPDALEPVSPPDPAPAAGGNATASGFAAVLQRMRQR